MSASASSPNSAVPGPFRQLTGAAVLSASCTNYAASRRDLARLGACLRRHTRRVLAAAAAGGSESSSANAPPLIKATGVPVLESLEQCSTLLDASAVALRAWGCRALQAGVLGAVLHLLDRQRPQQSRAGSDEPQPALPCLACNGTASFSAHAGRALLESAPFQAQRMLPWWLAASFATVACSLLKVVLARTSVPPALMDARTRGRALRGLGAMAQLLQDLSEEAVVVWGALTLADAKTNLLRRYSEQQATCTHGERQPAELLRAASLLGDVCIASATLLLTLANVGVNVPLLVTSFGASSLVAGLAGQGLLRNLVAGVMLYTTERPLKKGDHVILFSSDAGCLICEGTVIAIHATFTELRPKDKKGGRLIVNNADMYEKFVLHNKSADS